MRMTQFGHLPRQRFCFKASFFRIAIIIKNDINIFM